jgi:hypothetical protein
MNRWCIFYIVVLIAVGWLLATIPAPTPKLHTKPAEGTCLPPDGWTAAIEGDETNGWACVMRKGKKTKAFFYN